MFSYLVLYKNIFDFINFQQDYDDEYNEVKTEKNNVKPTEAKPAKKKKATSSFGFGYFGRFFNIFS